MIDPEKRGRSFFQDPRHKASGSLAFLAERASRSGDEEKAKELYTEAAKIETELALDVHEGDARILSLMAFSAVYLWVCAKDLQGARDAFAKITSKGRIFPGAEKDIKDMLESLEHSDKNALNGCDTNAQILLRTFGFSQERR